MAHCRADNLASVEDLSRFILEKNIRFIRLEFQDINGITRTKLTPSRNFEKYASDGVEFPLSVCALDSWDNVVWNSSLASLRETSHARFYPSLDGFILLPWKPTIARVLVNPRETVNLIPRNFSPHALLEYQLKRLDNLGISLFSAFEHEFHLIDDKTKDILVKTKFSSSGLVIAQLHSLFYEIEGALERVGVQVEVFHTESGQSQFEMTYKPSFGMKSAIDAVIFKGTIKEVCRQRGILASFMTKPWSARNSCSGHFNHSLWSKDGSTSLMHNPSKPAQLSEIASHWLAGQLAHLPALTTLSTATSNCFSRINFYVYAPSRATWSYQNRIASIRVRKRDDRVQFIENRVSPSACNPYIVVAASIAAGIDGIQRKLEPPAPLPSNQMTINDAADDSQSPKLPSNMEEGLVALQEDVILTEALGKKFVDNFMALKNSELKLFQEVLKNGEDGFEWARRRYLQLF